MRNGAQGLGICVFHGVDVTWDDIQIDDDAVVRRAESRSVGGGAWVQTWIWVPNVEPEDASKLPINLWE